MRASHRAWLTRAIVLSQRSRDEGNHPFAAIVVDASGNALAEAMNDIHADCTGHAEIVAVRRASAKFNPMQLRDATLYSSAEPCAMCAGAIYWSGIGRVVYALSEERLLQFTGNYPGNPTCWKTRRPYPTRISGVRRNLHLTTYLLLTTRRERRVVKFK